MKLRTKIGLGIVALVVVLSLTIASISGGSSEDKSAINNTTVVEVAETSVVVPTEVPALPLMTREECNYLGRSDVVFSAYRDAFSTGAELVYEIVDDRTVASSSRWLNDVVQVRDVAMTSGDDFEALTPPDSLERFHWATLVGIREGASGLATLALLHFDYDITIVEQVGESFVAGGDYAVKATELLGEFTGTHTAGCAD